MFEFLDITNYLQNKTEYSRKRYIGRLQAFTFLPYLSLASNGQPLRMLPMVFHTINGTSPCMIPYTSQKITPMNIVVL